MKVEKKNKKKLVAVVAAFGQGLFFRSDTLAGGVVFVDADGGGTINSYDSLEAVLAEKTADVRTGIYEGDVVEVTF